MSPVVILTEDTKQEYKEFRETLEELGVDEESYNKLVKNGEYLLAQIAEGLEQTDARLKNHYPQFGQLIGCTIKGCISQYDYYYRLLENYFNPETDDIENFKSDRRELLLALRNDFFFNEKGSM